MADYKEYFLMNADEACDYVKAKVDYFRKDEKLTGKEIGDGNVNYVFRVVSEDTGKSIIVKQAGLATRIDKNWFLSTDRGRIEAKILGIQAKAAPGLVPEVYVYDPVMCAIVMEDMINHTMMRTALMNHEIFPLFADHISTFLVNTLLATSDVAMEHKEKKEMVKDFINPELCEITEQLVYSEPYTNFRNRNEVIPENLEFVKTTLYDNEELKRAVCKLRFDFMNNAQCLIHGDLHTGSIFINKEHTYVFDPEFAFYGPAGYDIGNIIANLFFAYGNGLATIEDETEKNEYLSWLEKTISDIVDLFISKYHAAYGKLVKDELALSTKGFENDYLQSLLHSTAGVTGLELNRRIVGMAKVKDITSIADNELRARVERALITFACESIMKPEERMCGKDYIDAWKKSMKQFGF